MDRTNLFLQSQIENYYNNTERETLMVHKVAQLFNIAEDYQKGIEYVSPKNLEKWRKAYLGTLNALDMGTGEESKRKSKQLRKMIFEIVESKVDNSIPMPKITPRYKDDMYLIEVTENYLKFEMDKMLTEQKNDKSERATYIDGTSWYKVSWDSFDSSHERSGDVRVDVLLADQVVPEPGVQDYKLLNFIFEKNKIAISILYDMYGRMINPIDETNLINTISYYYKNADGIIGRFVYAPHSMQVITWEKDWQIRKIRTCTNCGNIEPLADMCSACYHESFAYENADVEVLEEDLVKIYNPYEEGESEDPNENMEMETFLEAGTEVPFYHIRQLPFVPRPSISSIDTIYGISEPMILLDMQDTVNKILTKVEDKSMKSGAVVTTPHRVKMSNADETFKNIRVKSAEEAAQVQVRQVMADVSQDIAISQLIYESARASSGVTESFQGKHDNTAVSGIAKQISAMQAAGRLESLREMKAAAFAGVYELILKYLLAFSDEDRRFVRTLPDGLKTEMVWNKYMFLRKGKNGTIYYADDFAFSTDPAATLSNNRTQMWQETMQQFTMGSFGDPKDPRVLKLFWNILMQMQYPLAKIVLSGIEELEQHLPPELEQAIMQNPEVLQLVQQILDAQGEQRGGAREGAGQKGNNFTHAANVDRNNQKLAGEVERGSDQQQAMLGGGNI